jgi:hypothetical protein
MVPGEAEFYDYNRYPDSKPARATRSAATARPAARGRK